LKNDSVLPLKGELEGVLVIRATKKEECSFDERLCPPSSAAKRSPEHRKRGSRSEAELKQSEIPHSVDPCSGIEGVK